MATKRWTVILLIVMLVTGCGSENRHSLQGTVTLDGQPLDTGVIQFLPLPGTNGPSAGDEIKAGHFTVDSAKGVFAGNFRVEITSVRKTGNKIRTTWGELTDELRNFVPPKYNEKSELTVEVTPHGPATCDFALKST